MGNLAFDTEFHTINAATRATGTPWPTRTLNGREYWVVPFVSLVEGVLNGSKGPLYYPGEEIRKNPGIWNGIPLTHGHPQTNDGRPLAGKSQEVKDRFQLGTIYNDWTEANRRGGEAWFDKEWTRNRAPGIARKLDAGELIELSTGLGTQDYKAPPYSKDSKGRYYHSVARNYEPDHLAVLDGMRGACSLADGCGIGRNSECSDLVLNDAGEMLAPKADSGICPVCGSKLDSESDCPTCGWSPGDPITPWQMIGDGGTKYGGEKFNSESLLVRMWDRVLNTFVPGLPRSTASGKVKRMGSGTGKGPHHEAAQAGFYAFTPSDQEKELGADAAKQKAETGHNPPNWAVDESLWEKAKEQAAKSGHSEDWAYVVGIYQRMGGEIKGKSTKNSDSETEVIVLNTWSDAARAAALEARKASSKAAKTDQANTDSGRLAGTDASGHADLSDMHASDAVTKGKAGDFKGAVQEHKQAIAHHEEAIGQGGDQQLHEKAIVAHKSAIKAYKSTKNSTDCTCGGSCDKCSREGDTVNKLSDFAKQAGAAAKLAPGTARSNDAVDSSSAQYSADAQTASAQALTASKKANDRPSHKNAASAHEFAARAHLQAAPMYGPEGMQAHMDAAKAHQQAANDHGTQAYTHNQDSTQGDDTMNRQQAIAFLTANSVVWKDKAAVLNAKTGDKFIFDDAALLSMVGETKVANAVRKGMGDQAPESADELATAAENAAKASIDSAAKSGNEDDDGDEAYDNEGKPKTKNKGQVAPEPTMNFDTMTPEQIAAFSKKVFGRTPTEVTDAMNAAARNEAKEKEVVINQLLSVVPEAKRPDRRKQLEKLSLNGSGGLYDRLDMLREAGALVPATTNARYDGDRTPPQRGHVYGGELVIGDDRTDNSDEEETFDFAPTFNWDKAKEKAAA